MKREFKSLLALCAIAVASMWAGGCAKQQVVKPDQMIPPAATATAKPAKPAVAEKKAEVKDAGVSAGQVAEAAAPATPATSDAAVKAALEKVYFNFDSYELSAQARETLTKNAELLKKDGQKVQIQGNCDELGSDDYNLALGDKRAKAAAKYLQTLGVPADRLSTISYGKEKPADPGHDDAARAKNRRDEFVVVSK